MLVIVENVDSENNTITVVNAAGEKIMKKKIITVVAVAILFILLFPTRNKLKDGGSVECKALLYKISKIHSLIPEEEMEKEGKIKLYDDGFIIEILGFEVYNSVK